MLLILFKLILGEIMKLLDKVKEVYKPKGALIQQKASTLLMINFIFCISFVLFAAIIGSLTMTAFYGKLKHDRYYTGTIEAVQKTQIELSISMLKLLEKKKGT